MRSPLLIKTIFASPFFICLLGFAANRCTTTVLMGATLLVKVETPKKIKIQKPKNVSGYMDIPWGTSSEQILDIFNANEKGYSSALDRNQYSLEIFLDSQISYDTAEFIFSSDKSHLKMVLVHPYGEIKQDEFQNISKVHLNQLIEKYGKPSSTKSYTFAAGKFIIHNWKFTTTKIEFGEFLDNDAKESRFVIRYLPTRMKGVWDLRDRLYPYRDRTTGDPLWEME